MRVQLLRQVQIRIERMQAIHTLGSVTGPLHRHFSEHGFQSALVNLLLLSHNSVRALDRTVCRTRTADIRYLSICRNSSPASAKGSTRGAVTADMPQISRSRRAASETRG